MLVADIERQIVEGIEPEEDPADVLFMAGAVADRLERPLLDKLGWVFPIPRSLRWPQGRALFAAGLLLCPIFDPVKHRNYSENMIEMRRRHKGIARHPDLRERFRRKVGEADKRGALKSLQAAENLRLWSLLDPAG